MKKNSGKMYKGKVKKDISTIQKIYYSKSKSSDSFQKSTLDDSDLILNKSYNDEDYESMSVSDKIDYLLGLPGYLPDFIVEIKTKDEIIYTELDHRTKTEIVTKNNTVIEIKDILDIEINN